MQTRERNQTLMTFLDLPVNRLVRRHLGRLLSECRGPIELLDVGGRESPYTSGIPAKITISELRRETEVQRELNLGVDEQMVDRISRSRSNIKEVIFDDMTRSGLPDNSFDGVVAVEVLEHVDEDELFVRNVCRVLKPGGFFLMTTPNGDFIPNKNPDHRRHYSRDQLAEVLSTAFVDVDVHYAVPAGFFHRLSLVSPKRHPLLGWVSIIGKVVNRWRSADQAIRTQRTGTAHLVGIARKASGEPARSVAPSP